MNNQTNFEQTRSFPPSGGINYDRPLPVNAFSGKSDENRSGADLPFGQLKAQNGNQFQPFTTPVQNGRAFGSLSNPFAECRNSAISSAPTCEKTATNAKQNQQSKSNKVSLQSNRIQPNLKPIKVIGNGAFGYVFEAECKNTDQRVALKRTQKVGNIVSREYEVLSLLIDAPNVVQLLDFFYTTDQCKRLIQNSVMEYCDCSLELILKKAECEKQKIPMDQIKHFMRQLFTGLQSLHNVGVCHRDLKPENILLKWPTSNQTSTKIDPYKAEPLESELKVADLGSAKVLDQSDKRMNTPYVVSRYYRAPELIMGSHLYDFSIDIWAAGCILFELIARTPLFPGESEGMQLLEHSLIKGKPSANEIERMGKLCEKPVIELLKKNQSIGMKKVNMFELLKKLASLENGYDLKDIEFASNLINRCLMWVPEDRITAQDAFNHEFLK